MAVKTPRQKTREAEPVGKKKKDEGTQPEGRTPIGKQVNVRIPAEVLADLEFIAADANLDISAVIRMILSQNVETYVRQIHERKQRQEGK